jgi:hypothetical protein
MATTVKKVFRYNKTQVIDIFPQALNPIKMSVIGCHFELGLVSFGENDEPSFYAHVVEQKDQSTNVAIAPALSYMKDRNQAEVPVSAIEKIMDQLNNALKNGR